MADMDVSKPDDPHSLIQGNWPKESELAYSKAATNAGTASTTAGEDQTTAVASANRAATTMSGQTENKVETGLEALSNTFRQMAAKYTAMDTSFTKASDEIKTAKEAIVSTVTEANPLIDAAEAAEKDPDTPNPTPSSQDLIDGARSTISTTASDLDTSLTGLTATLANPTAVPPVGTGGVPPTDVAPAPQAPGGPSNIPALPPTAQTVANTQPAGDAGRGDPNAVQPGTQPQQPGTKPHQPSAPSSSAPGSPSSGSPSSSSPSSGSPSSGSPSSGSNSGASSSGTGGDSGANSGANSGGPMSGDSGANTGGPAAGDSGSAAPMGGLPGFSGAASPVSAAANAAASAASAAPAAAVPTSAAASSAGLGRTALGAPPPPANGMTPGTATPSMGPAIPGGGSAGAGGAGMGGAPMATAPAAPMPPGGGGGGGGPTPPPGGGDGGAPRGTPESRTPGGRPMGGFPGGTPIRDVPHAPGGGFVATTAVGPPGHTPSPFQAEHHPEWLRDLPVPTGISYLALTALVSVYGEAGWDTDIAVGKVAGNTVFATADGLSVWPAGVMIPAGVIPLSDMVDTGDAKKYLGTDPVTKLATLVNADNILSTTGPAAVRVRELIERGATPPVPVSRGMTSDVNMSEGFVDMVKRFAPNAESLDSLGARLRSARATTAGTEGYASLFTAWLALASVGALADGDRGSATWLASQALSLSGKSGPVPV